MSLFSNLLAIAKTILSIYTFIGFGWLYTLIRSVKNAQRKELEAKVDVLNDRAVAALGCGATEKYIILPTTGLRMHIVEAGSSKGQFIVLLHGFPESWYCWKRIITPLVKAGYHVVAPDLRGYNLSEKPPGVGSYVVKQLVDDIVGIWQYYERTSGVLVAHDWGGVIAWTVAAEHPELLAKLVVINGPHPNGYLREARTLGQILSSWYMLAFQIPFLPENLLTFDAPQSVARTIKGDRREQRLTPDDVEIIASGWVQKNAMTSMLNYYRAMVRNVISTMGRRPDMKVNIPALVIWGENDTALVKGNAEVKKWVPDVKVHYIQNCSHWVMLDAPQEVTQQILDFVK